MSGATHPGNDQLRGRLSAHKKSLPRSMDDPFRRRPLIRHEKVDQLARLGYLTDVEGDALGRMHELPRIQEPSGDVFRNLGAAFAQDALARRDQHVGQHQLHRHHAKPEIQDRPRQPEGGKARGLHYHQLAFLHQPVHHIDRRGKGRDRQHQPDRVRQCQDRELQEHPRRLAIADQLVKQADGPVHPIDRDQHQREKPKQLKQLRQEISVESRHARNGPYKMWG